MSEICKLLSKFRLVTNWSCFFKQSRMQINLGQNNFDCLRFPGNVCSKDENKSLPIVHRPCFFQESLAIKSCLSEIYVQLDQMKPHPHHEEFLMEVSCVNLAWRN